VEESARLAAAALAELAPIDVLVLGMGEDGHTASLFPGSPNLREALGADCPQRCLPMLAPSVPRQRLTLTLPLLASAQLTLLAVQGQAKLATLADALAADDVAAMPIRAFLHRPLEIHWCP
jgi:6-phosphogluconolactonase